MIIVATLVPLTAVSASAATAPVTVIDNTSPEVRYDGTWRSTASTLDEGGSIHFSSSTASASLAFSGTGIAWGGRSTNSSGISDVRIDGELVATVDGYSAESEFRKVLFTSKPLADGPHTIAITRTGKRNPASTGTNLIVDSFAVTNAAASLSAVSTEPSPSQEPTPAPVAEPVVEPEVEPVVDPVIAPEPVVESEPVVEPVVAPEPAVEPAIVSSEVVDSSATTAAAASAVGAGTYENGSSSISTTGSWQKSSSIYDNGGSVSFATRSASASLTFTGSAITVLSRKTSSSGINDILIDGAKVTSVDRYASSNQYKEAVYKTTSLSAGTHTITIAYTGRKNASSSGSNVLIDAFVVGETAVPTGPTSSVGVYEGKSANIVYSGSWKTIGSGSDSGGSSEYLNSGGSASLAFTGTAVRWVSRLTESAGIANVYLDGTKVASVDRYSSSPVYQRVVFERTDLSNAKHTLKIEWSGKASSASSGKNLLIDSIIVPDVTAPASPKGVGTTASGGKVKLTWAAVTASDLAGYRIFAVNAAGKLGLIGRASKSATSFTSIGAPSNTRMEFAVSAIDTSDNESARTAITSSWTGATPAGSHRYDNCPSATVTVRTPAELKSAIENARPGSVIRMASGTYAGQVSVTANGTEDQPIWLCGPRSAIVNVGNVRDNHGIIVSNSSHLVVTGMTVTNGLKGITVRKSNNVTVSDTLVESVGYEGIHLREDTTDSVVVGNTIRKTGVVDAFYGEGVYIGSSSNNWCSLMACQPDRSDRNAVLDNSISLTGSQPIEAKEGTTGGVIRGNKLDGSGAMSRAESWVKVKGNDWSVTSNTGVSSNKHGFQVNGSVDGWGLRNLFANNTATVGASGYGFELYEKEPKGSSDTIVSCSNVVSQAGAGFGNMACGL